MRGMLVREISASIQFFLIMLFALVGAFFRILPGGGGDGEFAVAINLREAWKNVAPYVNSALLIFGALSVIRLAVVFLAHSFFKKSVQ